MPQYNLKISFDQDFLPTLIGCGERVVLVKQTADDSRIAWVTFQPFPKNSVTWQDEYALYCSNTSLQAGATIDKLSDIRASDGLYYEYSNTVFTDPKASSTLPANSYGIINNMDNYDSLIFGLAQDVSINNDTHPNHPICASRVPRRQKASFTPFEKVEVYLEANTEDSMVLTSIQSKPIIVTFGGKVSKIHIHYNSMTGEFYEIKDID